jgi:hypothetical protein
MSALRTWRTVNPASLSSRRNTSQPVNPPRPRLTFSVAKTVPGLNGARGLTATRHPTLQLRMTESYMAESDSRSDHPHFLFFQLNRFFLCFNLRL